MTRRVTPYSSMSEKTKTDRFLKREHSLNIVVGERVGVYLTFFFLLYRYEQMKFTNTMFRTAFRSVRKRVNSSFNIAQAWT